ncbi:MAG TPA: cellulase family glycosylhydrolase [Chthonomonadaceae bacterium]|nr:cellulase family glycosylhydrolase [Chthonomonadaceae bacterium]
MVPDALGVNIHFTDPRPGEMEQLAGAGFRWVRMDFFWGGIERRKGVYDFAAYDRLMATLKAKKIRPIFILDYGNDLYQEGSPRNEVSRAAFARFAAAAVTHFQGQGILWEMWNEPNGGFWKPSANVDEYIALALETGKAIRAAAPEEWYIGPAVSGMDFDFMEKCFRAGMLDYWDAVSFHPYRNEPPETAAQDFLRVREAIAQYGKGKNIPILSGEWGYSELYPGLSLDLQSKYIARQFLSNLANGLIVSIWYDWHDDGTDPKEVEHHFGTVYNDYKPKPTYLAAQTLTRTLNGLPFNKRLSLASANDYCLLFGDGKNLRLAVWTTEKTPHKAVLPVSAGKFEGVDYLGEKAAATAGANGLALQLSDAPQYLIPEGENALLELAATWRTLPSVVRVNGENQTLRSLPIDFGGFPEGKAPPDHIHITVEGWGTDADPAAIGTRWLELSGNVHSSRVEITEQGRRQLRSRADENHRVRVTLTVDGVGSVAQETHLTPRNPLSLTPIPLPEGGLLVRIENLTGEPFSGRLFANTPGSHPLPLDFAPGEREKEFRIVPAAVRGGGSSAQFTIETMTADGNSPVLTTPGLRFTPLEAFRYPLGAMPPSSDYRVEPDGDPKVASNLTWTVVKPPAGLVGGADTGLRITYDFSPGWKFLRLSPQGAKRDPLPGEPYALGMWIYGDNSGDILNARFTDATGQTFQPTVGRIDWQGWRYVTFSLRADHAGYWGGAKDGRVHYPIHLDTVALVDSPGGRGGKGVVTITGITLIRRN